MTRHLNGCKVLEASHILMKREWNASFAWRQPLFIGWTLHHANPPSSNLASTFGPFLLMLKRLTSKHAIAHSQLILSLNSLRTFPTLMVTLCQHLCLNLRDSTVRFLTLVLRGLPWDLRSQKSYFSVPSQYCHI